MKVTILGCGHAGTTVAADLARKGHEVTILKTSSALHNEHFETVKREGAIIICENDEMHRVEVKVETNLSEAIKGRELLIIYIQTNYHEQLIKKIAEYIEDGQTILIEPGYLSTCYLLKYCKKDITIVEAESSPIDCRIIEPGKVQVLFRNVCNPVGVYPSKNKEHARQVLDVLDYNFEYVTSVIEAALHNPNLIVHTIGAIFSVPRIEYVAKTGEKYSMYREVFTPHVWNLVLALDKEKMEVLGRLGCPKIPYVEACKHRNSVDENRDATEVFFDYANNSSPYGPDDVDSRYVTEDVPEGLVLLESLGIVFGVNTPVCTSLIDIASALYNKNFRSEGRTVARLGEDILEEMVK